MAASSPPPESGFRRYLPLLFVTLAFALLLSSFPQLFGGAPQAPSGATATVGADSATPAATPSPVAAPPDDSTRTRIWNLIIVHPLEAGLKFLASDLALGAGTAIILFTILVKVVLLPLTLQQMRSQKAMMALKPEIDALQKKYGKDREKVSAETMALYKQYGVNPAAGCFPLVLQMPVLFGLYAALLNLAAHDPAFQQPWLWLARLDQPDVLHLGSITLPFILPVLAAATQWVQQRMMTMPTEDPQQRMQNQIMQFMPLMMLWFGLTFSAGLALYWTTQNIVGIVQQYFFTGWGSLFPNRARPQFLTARAGSGSRPEGGGGSSNGALAEPADVTDAATRPARPGPRTSGRAGHRDGRRRGPGRGGAGGGPSGPGVADDGRRATGKR
jgi:YidC/Oxa1 family membrane protein insertase